MSKDTVNYVQVELIPKTVSGTFSAAAGGSVTVSTGTTIDFTANSIINATTKAVYAGAVNVAAFLINPEAANFTSIMPGDLRGINTNNEERGLQSFGMMAVELSGAGGEKLQLASGKTATLNMVIPAGLVATAPATIPLWYFNDSTGLWKEQGSATKQGSTYSGTVAHFSFWNCDAPFQVVDMEALLVDQDGNTLSDAKVVIRKPKTNVSAYGYTDASGKVNGKIPANEALELIAYNKCGQLLVTKNIGPFATKTNLGTISAQVAAATNILITGTAINCQGQALVDGYVNVFLDGNSFRSLVKSGQFSITIPRCTANPATAEVYVVDPANSQQSSNTTLQVSNAPIATGQLVSCGTSTVQFINFKIDTSNYSLVNPPDTMRTELSDTTFYVFSNVAGSRNASTYKSVSFSFGIPKLAAGTYSLSKFSVSAAMKNYKMSGFVYAEVTAFGSVGQYVTGTIKGKVVSDSNQATPVPIDMSFRVLRTN